MLLVLDVLKAKSKFDVGGGSSDVAFFIFYVDLFSG